MSRDDAQSEVAVAFLEALQSYDQEMGSYRGWALGAAILRLYQEFRRERRYQQRTVRFRGRRPELAVEIEGVSGAYDSVESDDVAISGRDTASGRIEHPEDEFSQRMLAAAEIRADLEAALRRASHRLTPEQMGALARRRVGLVLREDRSLVYRALQILAEENREC